MTRVSRRLSGTRPDRALLRYLGALVLVGVAYYVGARVGLTLSLVERNVTPLWPPTGIAVAAFLVVGRSLWPGVAVAAFAVNLPISEGPLAAAVTAAGNTLAPLIAAVLLAKVGFRRQLDRRRDALSIVFLGALASTLVSATIGAGTLAVSGAVDSDQLLNAWAVWWTGDAMGVLMVTPFLLCLPLYWEQLPWSPAHWLEALGILSLAGATITWAGQSEMRSLYLLPPIVGWAAWRLQLRGAAPTALAVSLIATWSATRTDGWWANESLFARMFTLQTFNACIALTSFFLAALVSERNRTAAALETATVELEDRVARRTGELSAAYARLLREIQERAAAEEQLSQEEARAHREHEIAAALQRSLLPDRIPQIPAVSLAARYVPAASDVAIGGDWYDVIQLRGGQIGLAIGDVAGHGLSAAATMGQVRMALRAYATADPSPVYVMNGVNRLVWDLQVPEIVTLVYLVFDPATRMLCFTNAGHPPPLIFGGPQPGFLEDGLSHPLAVMAESEPTEGTRVLEEGSTLLLYTDGLVERRGESLDLGLNRLLQKAAGHAGTDVDALCDDILSSLIEPEHVADDIAILAMRPSPQSRPTSSR
jgi:serine phosphatase RsbU (regulator of sigma subunit)